MPLFDQRQEGERERTGLRRAATEARGATLQAPQYRGSRFPYEQSTRNFGITQRRQQTVLGFQIADQMADSAARRTANWDDRVRGWAALALREKREDLDRQERVTGREIAGEQFEQRFGLDKARQESYEQRTTATAEARGKAFTYGVEQDLKAGRIEEAARITEQERYESEQRQEEEERRTELYKTYTLKTIAARRTDPEAPLEKLPVRRTRTSLQQSNASLGALRAQGYDMSPFFDKEDETFDEESGTTALRDEYAEAVAYFRQTKEAENMSLDEITSMAAEQVGLTKGVSVSPPPVAKRAAPITIAGAPGVIGRKVAGKTPLQQARGATGATVAEIKQRVPGVTPEDIQKIMNYIDEGKSLDEILSAAGL